MQAVHHITSKSGSFELKYQRDNVRDSILHLFYVGKKACSACNNPENHSNVKYIKERLNSYCDTTEYRFFSTAISSGKNAAEESHYLMISTGGYDEIVSGLSIHNAGYFRYIWDGNMEQGSPQIHIAREKYLLYSKSTGFEDIERVVDTFLTYKGMKSIKSLEENLKNGEMPSELTKR